MSFITRIHAHIRAARVTRQGATMRPHDVKMGGYKEYSRMPRIALPQPHATATALEDALKNRSSFSQAVSNKPFSKEQLGTLLGHALGAREVPWSRNYPSAGALFPIETYIIGETLEGHAPGVFHYHTKAHALEHLWGVPENFAMSEAIRSPITPLSKTLIVFTAVWNRSAQKYGDLAYSHGLIEAGHMAQNIALVATALGIQNRPVAGCDDAYITELLDIDPEIEQFVYGMLLSPMVPARS